jgi:hypothetical protein
MNSSFSHQYINLSHQLKEVVKENEAFTASSDGYSFETKVFADDVIQVQMADRKERVLPGGHHLFGKLPEAFVGVQQIAVIGWGSQGPAQAQNLYFYKNINTKI